MSVTTPATFGNANHSESSSPARPFTFVEVPASRADEIIEFDQWVFPSWASKKVMKKAIKVLTPERNVGVEVVGQSDSGLAAFHSSYAATLPTPGGSVRAAALTWVGVHPQFRRRGVLTAMIDRHFADCEERNEPVSALFAAEMSIYQRFGYGQAATNVSLKVPRGAKLWDVPGSNECTVRLENYDWDRHSQIVDRLFREVGAESPGWISRDLPQYQRHLVLDPPEMREKRENLRIAIVERDGAPTGFAFFARKLSWGQTGPDGTVTVMENVIGDAASARALWGVLLDLDLMSSTYIDAIALDDRLLSLLVDPRAATPMLSDDLFIRILDVQEALSRRTYQSDFSVALDIADNRLAKNHGTWQVSSQSGVVSVERTEAPAELSFDIRALATAYLGGGSLTQLARAGQIDVHNPGALAAASVAFGSQREPFCPWDF